MFGTVSAGALAYLVGVFFAVESPAFVTTYFALRLQTAFDARISVKFTTKQHGSVGVKTVFASTTTLLTFGDIRGILVHS